MMTSQIIAFFFVGLLTGGVAGLLGIGGGLLFVPFQIIIYHMMGVPSDVQMKMALGTSLASIILTTLSSSRAHNKMGAIYWTLVYKMSIGLILGSIIGVIAAKEIPGKVLEIIYGIVECVVGIYFFFMKTLHTHAPISLPNTFFANVCGFFIGGISALLGMGGGFITVPTLVFLHIPLRKAIGSSSAIAFIIASVGSIAYLYPGAHNLSYPYSIGMIYLPAFIPMTIGAAIAAPWGAKMTHEIPKSTLKKIFALILIVLGILVIAR